MFDLGRGVNGYEGPTRGIVSRRPFGKTAWIRLGGCGIDQGKLSGKTTGAAYTVFTVLAGDSRVYDTSKGAALGEPPFGRWLIISGAKECPATVVFGRALNVVFLVVAFFFLVLVTAIILVRVMGGQTVVGITSLLRMAMTLLLHRNTAIHV